MVNCDRKRDGTKDTHNCVFHQSFMPQSQEISSLFFVGLLTNKKIILPNTSPHSSLMDNANVMILECVEITLEREANTEFQ